MSTALAKKEPTVEALTTSPMDLIATAVAQGAGVEQLEKLLDLQLRWEANEARKDYEEAKAAFKKNPPEINKNKHVQFGNTNYDHATLDHVCEVVTEALSQHGITHRWRIDEQTKDWVKVTCILSKGIHSEETTLGGPPDSSGSKNAIQAIGSAVTYLQRYTLLAATGLAAKNGDSDGAGPKLDNLSEQLEWLANCATLDELRKQFELAYKKAKAIGDQKAMIAMIGAKDKRRKELEG